MASPEPDRGYPQAPGPDQFEWWRNTVAQLVMPVAVSSPHVADFTGCITSLQFGDVSTLFTVNRSVTVDRTRTMIRRSDPGLFFLLINMRGRQRVSQDRQHAVLGPGDMVLLHSSHLFHSDNTRDTQHQQGCALMWRPGSLEIPQRLLHRLVGVRLPNGDGVNRLVSRYLRTLVSSGGTFDAADDRRLSSVTIDLLSLIFGRRLGVGTTVPPERRDRVRFLRIRSFIQANLDDPRLTPEIVARAHHISLRSLHRLFEANAETTVARWIRDQRLAALRADLVNPELRDHLVSRLAQRWGLGDASSASRAFRAAYGVSPTEYRALHATDPAHLLDR